jgi:ankyrin repeat protein
MGLSQALNDGTLEEVKANLFWDFSAGINEPVDKTGRTPLHVAAEMGYEDIVAYLINEGADVSSLGHWSCGTTPLHLAARRGHLGVVRQLLEAEAAVYVPDDRGHTALDVARAAGHTDIAKLLAEQEHSAFPDPGTFP